MLFLLFLPTFSLAALTTYVKMDGQTQGWIKGDSTALGRENFIEAYEYHHLMEIPTGGVQVNHQTVIMTKPLDQSAPSLLRAMDNDEVLTVKFQFYRPNPAGGAEQEYYNVLLEDARVVSIEPLSPRNDVPDTQNLVFTERVRFSYGSITETWIPTDNNYIAVTH